MSRVIFAVGVTFLGIQLFAESGTHAVTVMRGEAERTPCTHIPSVAFDDCGQSAYRRNQRELKEQLREAKETFRQIKSLDIESEIAQCHQNKVDKKELLDFIERQIDRTEENQLEARLFVGSVSALEIAIMAMRNLCEPQARTHVEGVRS